MMGQFFRTGAARSAILVLNPPDTYYDAHDVAAVKAQPRTIGSLASTLATVFAALRNTPFDRKRSLMDVTTFVFAPEFGRTLRQKGKPVDATGTDHNPLSNSLLVGGKGIRGGCVFGASDFVSANDTLSKAHLALDPERIKVMGRPFDFDRGIPRADLPEVFAASDYLGINSVVNTLYHLFGVPMERWRAVERNGPPARILKPLLC
jgi:hypothetical protein